MRQLSRIYFFLGKEANCLPKLRFLLTVIFVFIILAACKDPLLMYLRGESFPSTSLLYFVDDVSLLSHLFAKFITSVYVTPFQKVFRFLSEFKLSSLSFINT